MNDLAIGDRHNRAVAGLGDNAEPKLIRIRAGQIDGSISRQHLLVCLVNLLVRLHGSVKAIQLEVRGDIVVALPHLAGPCPAFEAMVSLAVWANGATIPVRLAEDAVDITIDISSDPYVGADLYAWGAGWKSWVGCSPPTFARDDDRSECLGSYFAAAVVAGEVFKRSKGLKTGRLVEDDAYSLWTGTGGVWTELTDGPRVTGKSMPDCYLVGAGAVGQGVINVLGASGLADGYVVTIDHDHHDKEGTNLNRCFVAGVEDILKPKVDAVRRYRELTGLSGYEFHGTLSDYLVSGKPDLSRALLEKEQRDEYGLIISAVDINRSRQDIQGLRPRIVVGGSTDGLRAQSTWYGLESNAECLGCWNRPDDNKARAMAVEAELKGMSEDERRHRLAGNVNDLDAALSYLATAEPRCGQLGEADVRSFAGAVAPEFSVSFVSMAAAVMTAARLFAVALSREEDIRRRCKSLFQFKNIEAAEVTTARRNGCPHCSPAYTMQWSE